MWYDAQNALVEWSATYSAASWGHIVWHVLLFLQWIWKKKICVPGYWLQPIKPILIVILIVLNNYFWITFLTRPEIVDMSLSNYALKFECIFLCLLWVSAHFLRGHNKLSVSKAALKKAPLQRRTGFTSAWSHNSCQKVSMNFFLKHCNSAFHSPQCIQYCCVPVVWQ